MQERESTCFMHFSFRTENSAPRITEWMVPRYRQTVTIRTEFSTEKKRFIFIMFIPQVY